MDAHEAICLVESELAGIAHLDNGHGITIDRISDFQVLPPVSADFENEGIPDGPPELTLWIVFDDCSKSKSVGYLVVLDPSSREYGLGMKTRERLVFLGIYGRLVDALNAM